MRIFFLIWVFAGLSIWKLFTKGVPDCNHAIHGGFLFVEASKVFGYCELFLKGVLIQQS